MAAKRLCSIQDCGKEHYGSGFCRGHYYRLQKYGYPSAPLSRGLWDSPICRVAGCERSTKGLGLCSLHYRRFKMQGSFDKRGNWGDAKKFFEEVVLAYEGHDCLVWPFSRSNKGYGTLGIDGSAKTVSRLVCEKIYGAAPTPQHEAAHSCGRGHEACVAKRHLSWKTPKGNSADKVAHGTQCQGETSGMAKLKPEDIPLIRSLFGKMSLNAIGEQYGVCAQTIFAIRKGRTWRHIP